MGPGTHCGGEASGSGEYKQRHRLGSPLEISASPGTLLDNKVWKSSACSQIYALWLRKSEVNVPERLEIPSRSLIWRSIQLVLFTSTKEKSSLFKPCLVSGCCRIQTKQIRISLAGSETWKYLDFFLLVSCTKIWRVCEDALPCHSGHRDVNHVKNRGMWAGSDRQGCLGLAGAETCMAAVNKQLLQSTRFGLFAFHLLREHLKRQNYRDGTGCADSTAVPFPQTIDKWVSNARISSRLRAPSSPLL